MMEMRHTIDTNLHFFFIAPGSCQMEGITGLYNYISGYLSGILSFVTMLLLLVILYHLDGYRHIKQLFAETKNDFIEWMRFVKNWTHSTVLELIWTIIPTIILLAIGVPSFILLYSLDEIVDCQVVVKIIAYQWYWKYEYPVNFNDECDILNVEVLSYMRPNTDLTDYLPLRLLEVDMPLVLPHSVNVKLIITSKDVLHSFAVPALGIKMDAVPGRLNQVTVFITQPGVYYGQCSELCGVNHAYMPITIHAISFELYEQFLLKIAIAQEREKIDAILEKFFAMEETKQWLADLDAKEKLEDNDEVESIDEVDFNDDSDNNDDKDNNDKKDKNSTEPNPRRDLNNLPADNCYFTIMKLKEEMDLNGENGTECLEKIEIHFFGRPLTDIEQKRLYSLEEFFEIFYDLLLDERK